MGAGGGEPSQAGAPKLRLNLSPETCVSVDHLGLLRSQGME